MTPIKTKNTFTKGMILDLDIQYIPKDAYREAYNFRLVSNNKTGSLEVIKGNNYLSTIDTEIGNPIYKIIGSVVIKDSLILFVTSNTGPEPTAGVSKIIKADFNNGYLVDVDTLYTDSVGLGYLTFSQSYPIQAVSRYESDNVQKIYWVDHYNNFRYVNIADVNIATKYSYEFDILPNVDLVKPTIVDVIDGNLEVGIYQYAYQMFYKNGAESVFSSLTNPFHITGYEGESTTLTYKGADVETDTNKGIRILIDYTNAPNTNFDAIRVVSLFRSALNAVPVINVIAELELGSSGTIIIDHTGQSLSEYTLEEFSILSTSLFTAKDIESKDNILFVANIKENYFDVDYDARAYRFNVTTLGNIYLYQGDAALTSIDFSGTFPNGTVTKTYLSGSIDADGDCINPYNDFDYTGTDNKYWENGTTIGGVGENVRYSFKLTPMKIDNNSNYLNTDEILTYYTSIEGTTTNPLYYNYASPFNYEKLLGYQRGETYRFAIVFFDEKGRSSYVKWIGDIRMPEMDDENDVVTLNEYILDPYEYQITVDHTGACNIDSTTASPYSGTITSITDNDGIPVVHTSSTSGLSNGYVITICDTSGVYDGSTPGCYDGTHTVANLSIGSGTFELSTRTYVGNATGVWTQNTPITKVLATTSVAHNYTTGDTVYKSGTTDYNGDHIITVIGADTFTFNDTWVSDQSGYSFVHFKFTISGDSTYSYDRYFSTYSTDEISDDILDEINTGNFDSDSIVYATDTGTDETTIFIHNTGKTIIWSSGTGCVSVSTISSASAYYKYGLFNTIQAGVNKGVYAFVLNPVFDIQNTPSDATSWAIVRCKRESNDRSILANGPISQTRDLVSDIDGGIITADTALFPDVRLTFTTAYGYTENLQLLNFISPEIVINKNLTYKSGDYLRLDGEYWHSEYSIYSADIAPSSGTAEAIKLFYFKHLTSTEYFDIIDFLIVDPYIVGSTPSYINISNSDYSPNSYLNYSIESIGATPRRGSHGTTGLCSLDIALDRTYFNTPGEINSLYLCSYRRNKAESRYGGVTNFARSLNEYIQCTDIYEGDQSSINCFNGDTFIDFFEYVNTMWEDTEDVIPAYTQKVFKLYYIPLETSINLSLRHGTCARFNIDNNGVFLTKEYSGNFSSIYNTVTYNYTQNNSLYDYNSVYSSQNDIIKFYPEPISSLGLTEQTFETRVKYSDLKSNLEESDSWLKFRVNNFLDVDSDYNEINNIKKFNNKLYFWQNDGFGELAVNQRSLIQDNNLGTLQLGTGGVLERYDYISQTVGNRNEFGIARSERGLYWIDNDLRDVYMFNGQLIKLSEEKNVQSVFKPLDGIYRAVLGYDAENSEILLSVMPSHKVSISSISGTTTKTVIFNKIDDFDISIYDYILIDDDSGGKFLLGDVTVSSTTFTVTFDSTQGELDYLSNGDILDISIIGEEFTLCYNEKIDAFTSFYTIPAFRYYTIHDNLFSSENSYGDRGARIYQHNTGYNNVFYDYDASHISADSTLTIIINDSFDQTKVFDSLQWYSNSESPTGSNILTDTFYEIENYNDYQHSGEITLAYGTNIIRREREFSINIPRNVIDTNVTSNPNIFDSNNWDYNKTLKERMRDKYLTIKLSYDPGSTTTKNRFNVSYINSIFRISKR